MGILRSMPPVKRHTLPAAAQPSRRPWARQSPQLVKGWVDDVSAERPGHSRGRPHPVRLDVAIHEKLLAAVNGRRGAEAADRLCEACVVLLDIDAAAISLVFDGANSGTLGSSGEPARIYDELQFTVGEGPCVEAVIQRIPILVLDLAEPAETRWPAYRAAMLAHRIRGVYAIPVAVAGESIGALDLFRTQQSPLPDEQLAGALAAAEFASLPILDLLSADLQAAVGDPQSDAWTELNLLSRAEVSRATGMLVAQLEIEPAEALIRLRAHAYATGRSATDVARDILDRQLKLDAD
jgi:hypothetical protein